MAQTIEELQSALKKYEENGPAKLAYALNRKMNEMADMLNKSTLSNLDLTDPKDKTFERLKVVWNDCATVAAAFKALAESAGVTNDEVKDIARKPFIETIADRRQ